MHPLLLDRLSSGEQLGLDARQRHDLYYTLLLGIWGAAAMPPASASSISPTIFTSARLQAGGWLPSEVVNFVLGHTGLQADLLGRFRSLFHIFRNGDQIANELILTCYHRGDIARQLRSATRWPGILSLDEHWSGKGAAATTGGRPFPFLPASPVALSGGGRVHAAAGPDAVMGSCANAAETGLIPPWSMPSEALADDAFWRGWRIPRWRSLRHPAGQGGGAG